MKHTYIVGTHLHAGGEQVMFGAGHTLRSAIRDARKNTLSTKTPKEHFSAPTDADERWEIYVCNPEILALVDYYGDGLWGNQFWLFDEFYEEFKRKNLISADGENVETASWGDGFPQGFDAGSFVQYHHFFDPCFRDFWSLNN